MTTTSFGKEIAQWTLDNAVDWALEMAGELQHCESLVNHLLQNDFDGAKLAQLLRSWQWDWERAVTSGGGGGGEVKGLCQLRLSGRPRDFIFSEADSKLLYDTSVRLCGLDPAIVAERELQAAWKRQQQQQQQQELQEQKQQEQQQQQQQHSPTGGMLRDSEERKRKREPSEDALGETKADEESAEGKSLRAILAEMEEAERRKREEEERSTLEIIRQMEEEERAATEQRRLQREREDEMQAKEFARRMLEEERARAVEERKRQEEATQRMITEMLQREADDERRRKLEEEETSAQIAKELQAKEEELKEAHCEICMDDFDPMDKFIMGECNHYFCRDCALEYFKGSLNEFPIKCPQCKEPVSDDALELILPPDLFRKYEKFRFERALQNDKDFCRCLTPDCENGVIIARDAGLPDKAWQWKCDVCTKKYCLKCNDDTHDSTCEAYQQWKKENGMADDKFQELVTAGLLKLCPHCNTRTQKTEGCNFMTCQLCKKHWCWECGLTHAACPGGHNSHK